MWIYYHRPCKPTWDINACDLQGLGYFKGLVGCRFSGLKHSTSYYIQTWVKPPSSSYYPSNIIV